MGYWPVVVVVIAVVYYWIPSVLSPVRWSNIPPLRVLEGVLAPNELLSTAQFHLVDLVIAPEVWLPVLRSTSLLLIHLYFA